MNEIVNGLTVHDHHRMRRIPLKQLRPDAELNNNKTVLHAANGKDNDAYSEDNLAGRLRKKYNHHSSSASASGSDISVDEDIETEIETHLQEVDAQEDKKDNTKIFTLNHEDDDKNDNLNNKQESGESGTRRIRSMSDGSPCMHGYNPDGEPFEVFPSLPDSVLEKLELNGHRNHKERLHEDEVEQKFVSLSLAFTIDATTIEHRCERQRRCRDQTETNLNSEIERLVEKAHRLRPLCVDAETTELLTGLLSQVDVIVQAAEHAAIAAERYGAVQHEARLADSSQLMISHVHFLKQQRDFARRQLVYTKRVLQDTSQNTTDVHKHGVRHGSHGHVFHGTGAGNARMVTRRRASIATLPHQDIISHGEVKNVETRKITRRTSELTLRSGNVLPRTIRSPRLELGLDLVQIRENTVEYHHGPDAALAEVPEDETIDNLQLQDLQSHQSPVTLRESFSYESHPSLEEEIQEVEVKAGQNAQKLELCTSQLKYKVRYVFKRMSRHFGHALTTWLDEGAQGSFFYFCALVCFALSIVSLGNVLVEMEVERGGTFLHWLYNA